jgi:hypothetical protein
MLGTCRAIEHRQHGSAALSILPCPVEACIDQPVVGFCCNVMLADQIGLERHQCPCARSKERVQFPVEQLCCAVASRTVIVVALQEVLGVVLAADAGD